jgi:hypothetical protein
LDGKDLLVTVPISGVLTAYTNIGIHAEYRAVTVSRMQASLQNTAGYTTPKSMRSLPHANEGNQSEALFTRTFQIDKQPGSYCLSLTMRAQW